MTRLFVTAVAAGLALSATAPLAQTAATATAVDELLIRVDVGEVADQLAVELGVPADSLPRSVEVPVEVAAELCEFSEGQLETLTAAEQHLECRAMAVTDELTQAAREALER